MQPWFLSIEKLRIILETRDDLRIALEKALQRAAIAEIKDIPQYFTFLKNILTHIPTQREMPPTTEQFHLIVNSSPRDLLHPSGWLTFNQFFARHLKPGKRPIAAPCNDAIIVSAADSVYLGSWPIYVAVIPVGMGHVSSVNISADVGAHLPPVVRPLTDTIFSLSPMTGTTATLNSNDFRLFMYPFTLPPTFKGNIRSYAT